MANVLIIDDDFDTVVTTRELLESAGHQIRVGYNGQEGLTSLSELPLPDCLLLDVEMPVLSGPGMARQMRLHASGQQEIPILLVSAGMDLRDVAARMGTPYFLVKASRNYGGVLLEILDRALVERHPPASA